MIFVTKRYIFALQKQSTNITMPSIEDEILKRVEQKKTGTVFLTEDFFDVANSNALRVALHRLVKSGVLFRLANGIYVKPQISKLLNKPILPALDEIAKAIAKRDKARLIPTGSYALNALGLSNQVPLNAVYYTDGKARTLKINNQKIIFKKASTKKLALKDGVSMLAVLALSEIGKDKVTENEIQIIAALLKKEDVAVLQHNLKIAPLWIAEIMSKTLKE